MRTCMLFVVLLFGACTGAETPIEHDDAAVDGPATSDGGLLSFGAPCQTVTTHSTECETGACAHFDMVTTSPGLCTQQCASDTTCPTGSMGKKCNGMGYCRP